MRCRWVHRYTLGEGLCLLAQASPAQPRDSPKVVFVWLVR